jgi:hypothetical protein
MNDFLKGLCVRVGGGLLAILIPALAFIVGSLLGTDRDEMFAWSLVVFCLLFTGTLLFIRQVTE